MRSIRSLAFVVAAVLIIVVVAALGARYNRGSSTRVRAPVHAPDNSLGATFELIESHPARLSVTAEVRRTAQRVLVVNSLGERIPSAEVRLAGVLVTVTDQHGMASVEGRLPLGEGDTQMLEISAAGYRVGRFKLPTRGAPDPIEVVLAFEGVMLGVVLHGETSLPVEGAAVAIVPSSSLAGGRGEAWGPWMEAPGTRFETTDSLGRFRFDEVDGRRSYYIFAGADCLALVGAPLAAEPPFAPLELRLTPVLVGMIRLLDADGGPPKSGEGFIQGGRGFHARVLGDGAEHVSLTLAARDLIGLPRLEQHERLFLAKGISGRVMVSGCLPGYRPFDTTVLLAGCENGVAIETVSLVPATSSWGSLRMILPPLPSALPDRYELGTVLLRDTEGRKFAWPVSVAESDPSVAISGVPWGEYDLSFLPKYPAISALGDLVPPRVTVGEGGGAECELISRPGGHIDFSFPSTLSAPIIVSLVLEQGREYLLPDGQFGYARPSSGPFRISDQSSVLPWVLAGRYRITIHSPLDIVGPQDRVTVVDGGIFAVDIGVPPSSPW